METSNVYPEDRVEIVGFKYCSDLHLTRSIKAVRTRRGEDAKYLVGTPYRATVKVRSEGSDSNWHRICVPQGYKTDLASVPQPLRLFVSRAGPHLEACVIHDWLYEAWIVTDQEPKPSMKDFADRVLKAALKEAKVGKRTIWWIYQACSKFGGKEFRGKAGSNERPSKADVIALDVPAPSCGDDEGCMA